MNKPRKAPHPPVIAEAPAKPLLREADAIRKDVREGSSVAAKTYAAAFDPLPDDPRAVVALRCLDGGDVELTVNGQTVHVETDIILRWGRKRG